MKSWPATGVLTLYGVRTRIEIVSFAQGRVIALIFHRVRRIKRDGYQSYVQDVTQRRRRHFRTAKLRRFTRLSDGYLHVWIADFGSDSFANIFWWTLVPICSPRIIRILGGWRPPSMMFQSERIVNILYCDVGYNRHVDALAESLGPLQLSQDACDRTRHSLPY